MVTDAIKKAAPSEWVKLIAEYFNLIDYIAYIDNYTTGIMQMQPDFVKYQGNQFWFKTLRMVNESRRQSNMILEIAFLD